MRKSGAEVISYQNYIVAISVREDVENFRRFRYSPRLSLSVLLPKELAVKFPFFEKEWLVFITIVPTL
jgi:hypothetical protein